MLFGHLQLKLSHLCLHCCLGRLLLFGLFPLGLEALKLFLLLIQGYAQFGDFFLDRFNGRLLWDFAFNPLP